MVDGARDTRAGTTLTLDLAVAAPTVTVRSESGCWEHRLRPRHAELLCVLAAHPLGRTAAQLSSDIFGAPGHEVAVRAELNRVRSLLGQLVTPRPYRFADWVTIEVTWPGDRADLLARSTAPAVDALRHRR